MSFEKAHNYLESRGYADRILKFDVSSATVALAAQAIGCKEAEIAKSLTFMVEGAPVMIICAGDVKIDNSKFKGFFRTKAVMLRYEEVSELIGHEVGGVCPFGINDGVAVYLDESLRRFDTVYPACGDAASAVKLTVDELAALSQSKETVDVCKMTEAQ